MQFLVLQREQTWSHADEQRLETEQFGLWAHAAYLHESVNCRFFLISFAIVVGSLPNFPAISFSGK